MILLNFQGSQRNSSNIGVVIMENLESTWVVFRKIGWLALLGFGVIVLSGPILAVLSVLLSVGAVIFCFALVGFIVWSFFQFAIHGQEAASERVQAMSRNATQAMGRFARACARIMAFPFRAIVRVGDGLLGLVWLMTLRFWLMARFLGKTSVLTMTGALVGVAVGVMVGAAHQNMDVAVPLNAVIGGAVGTLVGAALILLEKKSPAPVRFQPAMAGGHPLSVRPAEARVKL
jgi:hypothetical protein